MVAARGGVRAVVGGVAATALGTALTAAAFVPAGGAQAATGGGFQQVDLVSDVPGMAQLTDPAVVNPWGIALGPTTPAVGGQQWHLDRDDLRRSQWLRSGVEGAAERHHTGATHRAGVQLHFCLRPAW